jgi:NitT/TauT family transport system substrate-binding protein
MSRSLTVMEPFRSPFYAPLLAAVHRGDFAREGLDVTVRTAPRSAGTVAALMDGEVEICLGGLMRSFEVADRGGPFLPHFAEVNSRNGFFLVSREPRPGFRWPDLVGKTVISFAEAPTPWLCMLAVLRREGVDPALVTIERQRPVAEAVDAFLRGHGDFLEQGQPVVEKLLADRSAHLVASMGDATGPLPFSSFMTTPEFLRAEGEVVAAFTRAIYRMQRWIAVAEPVEIARTIAPALPDVAVDVLAHVVDRFRRQDTWARDPVLRRPGFDALQRILRDAGFIQRTHRYEDLVDVQIAERVVAETVRPRLD